MAHRIMGGMKRRLASALTLILLLVAAIVANVAKLNPQ
jgi:hypothetical protein